MWYDMTMINMCVYMCLCADACVNFLGWEKEGSTCVFEVRKLGTVRVWDVLSICRRSVILGVSLEPSQTIQSPIIKKRRREEEKRRRKNSRPIIAFTINLGQIRSRDLPALQLIPINLPEPRMRKYVSRAMLQVPKPLRRVALHELQNDIGGIEVERGPANTGGPGLDLFVQLDRRLVWFMEGRQAREHLEDEHAEGVPIYTFIVPCVPDDLNTTHTHVHTKSNANILVSGFVLLKRGERDMSTHLRRKVIRSPAERPHRRRAILREPKISNLDVPIEIEENIFRLEVAIDDIQRMEVVERERDFCRVELGYGIWKALWERIKVR